jgi:flavin reductase (DIM6/NTAB) family NADH-FMN oxidoreductase RutF
MKKLATNNIFIPMPMSIVGSTVNGVANFMAVGWVARANANPPMIAVNIGRSHYTCEGITENKAFSVNFPGTNLLQRTDYVGLVSGKNTDKSQVFETFQGELEYAPLIKEATLCLECQLVQTVELPTNNVYLGEIVAGWSDDAYMIDGKPDLKKMDVFFLSMPDNRYWGLGEVLGKAWNPENKTLLA